MYTRLSRSNEHFAEHTQDLAQKGQRIDVAKLEEGLLLRIIRERVDEEGEEKEVKKWIEKNKETENWFPLNVARPTN